MIKQFIKDKPAIYFLADKRSISEQLKELGGIIGNFFKILIVRPLKTKKAVTDFLKNFSGKSGAFGVYFKNKFYSLRLRKNKDLGALGSLDVSLFNKYILKGVFNFDVENENIFYTHSIGEAVRLVNSKKAKIAFLFNSTKISQLKEIVLEGKKMPPKSTYFYPKLLSGLVIHKF